MKELKNWNEISTGLYRYVISAGACYELLVMNWFEDTDILTADAVVYITGTWNTKNGTVFNRELILGGPVFECIEAAIKDNTENNK